MSEINKIIEDSFTGKGDIEGHLLFIAGLVATMNAKQVLETGVREGHSTIAILAALEKTDGNLISIDLVPSEFSETYKNPRWTFTKSDAVARMEWLSSLWESCFDIIMLDDWHTADHVSKELELCKKLVAPNHVIIIHDAMWGNTQPKYNLCKRHDEFKGGGPAGALQKLNPNEWEYMTVPSHNGLTLLRYKGV